MISEKQVIDFLKPKDSDYINRLISSLNNDFSNDESLDMDTCPICGSIHIKKNGRDHCGNQRYLYKDCHRTFCDKTNTLLYRSHLSMEQWKNFINFEISKIKLEDEAHFLGVSVTTYFYMRHKLYHVATEIINQQILSGEIEIDAQYASIICAVDDADYMIMNITGLGSESFDKYKANEKYFEDVKELISDSKQCIKQFANYLGAKSNQIPTSPIGKKYLTADGKSLGSNEMMKEIRELITLSRGIGTRYMQGYLNFNILRKQMKYKYKRNELAEKILE